MRQLSATILSLGVENFPFNIWVSKYRETVLPDLSGEHAYTDAYSIPIEAYTHCYGPRPQQTVWIGFPWIVKLKLRRKYQQTVSGIKRVIELTGGSWMPVTKPKSKADRYNVVQVQEDEEEPGEEEQERPGTASTQ
ncbi:hypothetical protein CYMTET_51739, partial [Cymbomonas tetramitiformis]